MAGHANILPYSSWSRTIANGTTPAVHHRTVAGWLSGKTMPFDNSLKSLSLATPNNVHKLIYLEISHWQITERRSCLAKIHSKFSNCLFWFRGTFRKVAKLRFPHTLFFLAIKAYLKSGIAIPFQGFHL